MWSVRQSGLHIVPLRNGQQSNAGFETSDLHLASFLHCRNFPLQGIKSTSDGRKICVFFDSSELRYAVLDYATDGVVPVRTFCMTLRELTDMTR